MLGDRAIVGRQTGGRDGDVPLAHPTVSRRHLEVSFEPALGCHVAGDCGSRNGSWLGATPLSQVPRILEQGAVLRAGDVVMVYESDMDEPADDPEVSRDAVPGESWVVRRLRVALAGLAREPGPALVVGETGAGKELVAAELHRLSGRSGPLISVNCAAFAPQLFEGQLFGHERGAFTGATSAQPGLFRAADRGSLFLDEFGELPLELQPKLLRTLERGEVLGVGSTRPVRVDVRVLAATNRALADEVERGGFRRDLYARLAPWELRVPPLRERRSDILAWFFRLCRAWARQCGRTGHEGAPALTPEVAEALLLHSWPDNLRGLHRLAVECARTNGAPLTTLPSWLPAPVRTPTAAPVSPVSITQQLSPRSRPTRDALMAALQAHDYSIRATARHLDRDRRQIQRWIETYEIELPHHRGDDD